MMMDVEVNLSKHCGISLSQAHESSSYYSLQEKIAAHQ